MNARLLPLAALLAAGAATSAFTAEAPPDVARPRLVVVLSIDQCRADYLTRFSDLYLPPRKGRQVGGFRYLRSRGAWYPDCRFPYHRTVTAAGHATIGTGALPYLHGVVGNSWFDRASGRSVYCVSDPKSQVVGALPGSEERPMSPATLLSTTVGDELELATGGRARTVSLSLKDRAAILMAGHRADTVVWFDEKTGAWVSSSYYCKNGSLPAWVRELNEKRLPDQLRQKPWVPSVSAEALARVPRLKAGTPAFSYPLTGKDYGAFDLSPAGNEFVFQSARQAVLSEDLGRDAVPDILTLNLASNDYVGHRFGPDSAEVLDISVQTDRQLSEFLNFLAGQVPGGLSAVTFAVTADHGVATVPEVNTADQVPAGRAVAPGLRDAAEKALDAAVGPADWIAGTDNGELYLGQAALARYPQVPRERLEQVACDALAGLPGVYMAVGRTAVLGGRAPRNPMGDRISHGVHPGRSGDVVLILDPHWLSGAAPVGVGTSHGTPFPYDTHVPLLLSGFGVRSGVYGRPVNPAQIAPTLAHLLGVARPSAADEPLLPGLDGVE